MTCLCCMLCVMDGMAVPARPGQWRTIYLADGTALKAELVGDENFHFYRTAEGVQYVYNPDRGYYVLRDAKTAPTRSMMSLKANAGTRGLHRHNAPTQPNTLYSGKKKGLIILVNFADTVFAAGHDQALYNRIANEENFKYGDFCGSVHDYFKAQSNGAFDLTFDVVGPVTLSSSQALYGGNNSRGSDMCPGEMVEEACEAVEDMVDFSEYDWNADGEVEQVFVLFAGQSEADGGAKSCIWPHKWDLESALGYPLMIDGMVINTYACSNELKGTGALNGIGVICHEFTHCLGLPDFYDTSKPSVNYAMGNYDLMAAGAYNQGSYMPPCYTAYEKMACGWLTPIELKNDTTVEKMAANHEHGPAYILYNEGNRDEYYLLENRQKKGWDAAIPGQGLLVTHVDYDATKWNKNSVNQDKNHLRCAIVPADGKLGWDYRSMANDLFPYAGNDSLNRYSLPAATLFNDNADGTKYLLGGLSSIKRNPDGTVSFKFKAGRLPDNTTGVVFYESFGKCAGSGGNDNQWDTVSGFKGTFAADKTGWSCTQTMYGGNQCAKFGSSQHAGATLTSPSIMFMEDDTLTFQAAGVEKTTSTVDVYVGNTLLDVITLKPQQWSSYQFVIKDKGAKTLRFVMSSRMVLDEVKVVRKNTPTAIRRLTISESGMEDGRIYSVMGQYMGTDESLLPPGMYIRNGKKFIKL